MNRSQWFIERKRIPLEKSVFRMLIIGVGLYIFTLSVIFLYQYFVNFEDIVNKNMERFGNGSNYENNYNAMKFVYLIRFWGNVLIGVLLEFLAYIYYKKTTAGYGFIVVWIALIVGLLITNFMLVKDEWYISLLSVISLFVVLTGLFLAFKELYIHRKALNIQYARKVKKGEL